LALRRDGREAGFPQRPWAEGLQAGGLRYGVTAPPGQDGGTCGDPRSLPPFSSPPRGEEKGPGVEVRSHFYRAPAVSPPQS
ncbi:MAG: hypothetical protein WBD79_18850, partial [Anaerolineae bacterium]